jgi:hypothetical protein
MAFKLQGKLRGMTARTLGSIVAPRASALIGAGYGALKGIQKARTSAASRVPSPTATKSPFTVMSGAKPPAAGRTYATPTPSPTIGLRTSPTMGTQVSPSPLQSPTRLTATPLTQPVTARTDVIPTAPPTPAAALLAAESANIQSGNKAQAMTDSQAYTEGAGTLTPPSTTAQNSSTTPSLNTQLQSSGSSTVQPDMISALRGGSSGLDEAQKRLLALYAPSAEEQALQDQLTSFQESARLGISGIEGQGRGIPLALVRGQQSKLSEQAGIQEQTLIQRLATAQAKRQADQQIAAQEYQAAQQEQARQDQLGSQAQQLQFSMLSAGYRPVDPSQVSDPSMVVQIGGQSYLAPTPESKLYEVGGNLVDQNGQVIYQGTAADKLLSPAEAASLGVPYGTTQSQAAGMGITPNSELTTSQRINTFNSIVDDYNRSPLIAASDRLPVLQESISAIQADPNNGTLQLNLAYSYIQALDTYQSAVREGELSLVNSIDSSIGQLSGAIQRLQNEQFVRPAVALQIADAAENIVTTIQDAAQQKAQSFASQANVAGVGNEWNQYLSGFTQNFNQSIPDTPENRQWLQGQGINPEDYFPNDLSTSQNGSQEITQYGNLGDTRQRAPVMKTISSILGKGIITGYGSKFWKPGLDFVLPGGKNADVKWPTSFTVISLDPSTKTGGFGNRAKIRLPDGKEMWVSHLDRFGNLRAGQRYPAGTILGKQGNTGKTYGRTGIHLDLTMPIPGKTKQYYSAAQVANYLRAA